MTVAKLLELAEGVNCTPSISLEREITCGYACDLLSWVMAHGKQGMAWISVQTHMNVVAVAVLLEFSCIILPEGLSMEEAALDKANNEGIPVIQSQLTAYELCGRMYKAGIGIPENAAP